jgi:hypothetical protein
MERIRIYKDKVILVKQGSLAIDDDGAGIFQNI